ncbi:UDP-2,3-diacylglucosamine diphosphatase [Terriglobus roseus]|uniref:UDP-2,3-diacylglucosamine pyrophosphatase LpxH n=1 Tax=Terriglobus roseus TaxID=392734 RepID=A0A1H4L5J1_9BACT|nr:UDP-2,3-diacylglucosamine diphosphatase [Terriglobus roseus]SEB65615.1 UDP-2,3-diacylglucosamine pyrophosphatase LpxH [Terriglobus roseus]
MQAVAIMVSTCDTLILSDLHLGSDVSRAEDAMELLEKVDFRQLILLGDIFSDLDFRRLKREHWDFLSCIRRLSNPKQRRRIVWVEGNHDHGLSNVMSHLVGVPVYQRYVWEYGGKRHLAVHGHQFDRFINENILLSRFFEKFYEASQRLDGEQQRLSRWFDRFSTRWLRLSDKVAEGALSYAAAGEADRVFCGHTHEALARTRGSIEYFNSGAWTDQRATFLTIDLKGVKIHEYPSRVMRSDSRKERVEAPAVAVELPRTTGLRTSRAFESIRC